MNEEIKADQEVFQRAYLIGVHIGRSSRQEVEEHLEELEALVSTLDVPIVGKEIVHIQRPSAEFLIGSGKVQEIKARAEALDADFIVFDDDLTPSQQGAWEKETKRAVIDRRKAILDIFAARAQTREARLQIELASLEYTLPRLKRAWTHLERQRGGRGLRGGAGEAQIETDRRLVRDRIAKLQREIDEVRAQRDTQRKSRGKRPVPNCALVGYTNSGKSTLLNVLTAAGVLAEDKLFATLDPTTRKIDLPNNQQMLLTDTVGFIRKLPTALVAAFKSTLEEAAHADFLIHVLDASHPQARDHFRVTSEVLAELGAGNKPTILVLNKMDRIPEGQNPAAEFHDDCERIVCTSAHTGAGIDELRRTIAALVDNSLADVHLRIPASRFDVVSAVHREAEVLEQKYDESDVLMHVLYPQRYVSRVAEYQTTPW